MKTRDIPSEPILRLLYSRRGKFFTWHGENRDLHRAFPPLTPKNQIRSKMAALVRTGLVSVCACGCRGEFQITEVGIEALTSGHVHAIDSQRRKPPLVTGASSQDGK
jgi:hypothetical protein